MSGPEEILHFQLKAADLGVEYWREFRFHPSRKWRFDFAWPDKLVACEIQGGLYVRGGHSRGLGQEKDCEKLSQAAALGWRVLPVSPRQVKSGEALKWIEAALTLK
jgi:hypothetical protein